MRHYRHLAFVLIALVCTLFGFTSSALATPAVTRLYGQTALDTMQKVVDTGFASTGNSVVLATVDGYWDALTASGIAGINDAPVLLTSGTSLSSQTRSELERLAPSRIIVCGGPAAVSGQVVEDAVDVASGARGASASAVTTVVRCFGATATGTADDIYNKVSEGSFGTEWSSTAFVATGSGYWDALSIAPYAYSKHAPIFLTEPDSSLSPETLAALKKGGFSSVYILGGIAAVPSSVEYQLAGAGISYAGRLSGSDAIATSLAVAEFEISNGMLPDNMGIATSEGYWDALTGASLCGEKSAPIVLASPSNSSAVDDFISANLSAINQVYIFGGKAAVSTRTEQRTDVDVGIDPILGDTMYAHFIDVGQGDSAFIELPDGRNMLIDAGPTESGQTVVNYLKSRGCTRIDYLVLSHPHEDHVGGMALVVKSFDVGEVWAPEVAANTNAYENFLDALSSKGLSIHRALAGKTPYQNGSCSVSFYTPSEGFSASDLNDWSIVARVVFGNTVMLFTGDQNASTIDGLHIGHVDVLKVAHHGSTTGTTQTLVSDLSPTYSVISVGANNSYGHPAASVLGYLSSSTVYRTDLNGTITATSDASTVTMSSEKASQPQNPGGSTDIVYYVSGGSKYHRSTCSTLKRSKNILSTTRADAIAQGLSACKVCNP